MRRSEIEPLTSLRFFAAGAIVLHHLIEPFGLAVPKMPLNHAVPFFFALSGFILTYNYEGLEGYRPGKFFATRIARLWPVHVACLMLGFILLPAYSSALATVQGWQTLAANVLLVHDWIPSYRFAFSFNAVSWSISAEMFFYALFPLLIVSRRRMLIGLIIALVTNIALLTLTRSVQIDMSGNIFERSPYFAYAHLHPVSSVPGFILGMLAASVFRQFQSVRLGFTIATIAEVAAVGIILWWFSAGFNSLRPPGLSPVANVYYSFNSALLLAPIIVFVFAWNAGAISRLLSAPILVLLGKISFATYMVHQIIISYAMRTGWVAVIGLPATICLIVVIVYVGSWILWRFVETPGRVAILSRLLSRQPHHENTARAATRA